MPFKDKTETIHLTSVTNNHQNYYTDQHDDSIGNDLHSYNDKTKRNQINEWQASWNITNAIQVTT
jgi:hypothetical protein